MIKKVFKRIDDFLIDCADYLSNNVRSGKVFSDIREIFYILFIIVSKTVSSFSLKVYKTKAFQNVLSIVRAIAARLMQIKIVENAVSVFFGGLFFLKKYYAEFFIVLTFTLLNALILLLLFEDVPIIFLVSFFPILFVNAVCVFSLYNFIDKKEQGKKVTLLDSLESSIHQFFSLATLILFHVFGVITLVNFFFAAALFTSLCFELFHIDWKSSYLYWYFVSYSAVAITISLIIFNNITIQAYFYILSERKKPLQAFKNGLHFVNNYLFQFLSLSLLLILFSLPLFYWAISSYQDLGFAVGLFFILQLSILYGFLLRRKLINGNSVFSEDNSLKQNFIFRGVFVSGVISYILFGFVFVHFHPTLIRLIQQANLVPEKLTTYVNKEYGYAIDYPKSWSIYSWPDKSVTIYNNYTGTEIGGIWVTIKVYSIAQADFDSFFNNKAGLLFYDPGTKEAIRKISNISIRGSDTVKYTAIKPGIASTQYETHYLVKRGERAIDIVFIALRPNVEDDNRDLFETMINSFRFIE